MPINTAHGRPLGEWIDDGQHKPFQASACALQIHSYDESQMMESDASQREERGDLFYDC